MAQGKGGTHAGQDALPLQGTLQDSADTPMHAREYLWVVGGNWSVQRKPLQKGQSTHAQTVSPAKIDFFPHQRIRK